MIAGVYPDIVPVEEDVKLHSVIAKGTVVGAVPTVCPTPFESTQSYISLASDPAAVSSEAVIPVGQAQT